MPPADVKNAADPEQVARAKRKSKRAVAEDHVIYHAVLATYEGRAVFWDLLTRCGLYKSVFHHNARAMAYQAGQQDVGHELIAWLIEVDGPLYLQMETEGRTRQTRAAAATTAAHIARADEGDET